MNLLDEDEVVGMQLNTQGDSLLIVSENGLGKRTLIEEFDVQHRGGKGVKCYKINDRTGNVIGVKAVDDTREIMLITDEGVIIQIDCSEISMLGRITSGVKLINLDEGVKVAAISKVRKTPGADDEVTETETEEETEEE
jgi:DNA gyrase subunit A